MLRTEKCKEHFRSLGQTVLVPFLHSISVHKATAFSLGFLLTALLTANMLLSHRLWLYGVLALTVFLILLVSRRKQSVVALCLPLLLGILLGNTQALLLWDVYAQRITTLSSQNAELTTDVELEEIVYTNAYMGSYICRFKIGRFSYHVRLETNNTDMAVGQVYTGTIQLCDWNDLNDGFDEEGYYRTKNVLSAAKDVDLSDTGVTSFRLTTWFQKWNDRLSARISAHVKNDDLPLAMLLGNRKNLADTISRDFRRVGILHLLAVSGTHFSVLATMAERLLKRRRMKPLIRNGILMVLAVGYMLLTGLSASVRRAGFMFLIGLFYRQFDSKVSYFTSLHLACLGIVLIDPTAVLDVGLHLSYVSICGCILTIRLETNWKAYRQLLLYKNGERIRFPKDWRKLFCPRYVAKQILSMLMLNLIITCLMLPLSWLYFGELSLVSMLMNLFYIPATGVLLYLSVLYLLVYECTHLPLLAPVLSAFAGFLEIPAAAVSQVPHIMVSLRYSFVPFFLIPSVLTVCCLPYEQRKLRGICRSALLLILMVGCIWGTEAVTASQSTLVYQNVNVKDGFVIRSDGKTLLIDVSDGSKNFTNMLLAHAKEEHATEIDGYLLTHYHKRHISTFLSLADNWILRRLYLPEPLSEEEDGIYKALCQVAKEHGIPVETFVQNTNFGRLTISVGPRTWLSRSTHPITGLRIVCGEESVVYTSCSYGQTAETIVGWMETCTVGIFGAHSPVHKKTFTLHFVTPPELVIWNGDGLDYYVGETPVAKREYVGCTQFRMRFAGDQS